MSRILLTWTSHAVCIRFLPHHSLNTRGTSHPFPRKQTNMSSKTTGELFFYSQSLDSILSRVSIMMARFLGNLKNVTNFHTILDDHQARSIFSCYGPTFQSATLNFYCHVSLPTRLESLLPMASTFYLKWTTSSFFRTVSSQRYVKFPSGCINYLNWIILIKVFFDFLLLGFFLGRHVH